MKPRFQKDRDINVQLAVIIMVGVVLVILTVGGVVAFLYNSDGAKDLWVIIGPIISAAITGFIGFLAGKRYGASNRSTG